MTPLNTLRIRMLHWRVSRGRRLPRWGRLTLAILDKIAVMMN